MFVARWFCLTKRKLPTSPDAAAAPVQYGVNTELNITSDPGRFVGLAADLIDVLSGWAARNSTRRYAAGVMTSGGEGFTATSRDLVYSIYGLVQCTPEQGPQACHVCLGRLRNGMPAVFNGTAGAQFNAVWCNLRYEVFFFYDGSPVVNLVAPPPPPPPLLAPSSQNSNCSKQGNGSENAATVIAIVLGVLVAVLASAFIVYVWRNAQAKQCEFYDKQFF